jgi:hypothetical protein
MQMKNQRNNQRKQSVQPSKTEKNPEPLLKKLPQVAEKQSDASSHTFLDEWTEHDSSFENMSEEKMSCNKEHHHDTENSHSYVHEEKESTADPDVEKSEPARSMIPTMQSNKNVSLRIAKIPILLSSVIITVDIFDSYDLEFPISSIRKITWSVNKIEGRLLLPKNIVFLKGILTSVLDYVADDETGSLKTAKINIPWQKNKEIEWIFPPDLPDQYQKYYGFNSFEGSIHWEQYEKYVEDAIFQVKDFRIVSTAQTTPSLKETQIDIQASASLTIDILQQQYVNLEAWSGQD